MECPQCQTNNPDDSKFCKECAIPLSDSDLPISQTKTLQTTAYCVAEGNIIAGKYKILGILGKGGMGKVYKAEDIRLKRTVALKFLSQQLTDDPEAKERFEQEAQAASALDHPNVCTIHEISETEEGQVFIAMAYYEGESLKDKIEKEPISQQEALDIASQLAQGLNKAHKEGIVHRDIKPANIMVTPDGIVKIVDFGIAKLSGQVRMTKTGATMGTVAYMSPEQARGEAVDLRTDIWSAGVVLYEMLTGSLPFREEHEHSMMNAVINEEPLPLRKHRPDLPVDLEKIVDTALAKKPENRYENLDDLLLDLNAVSEGFKPDKVKKRPLKARLSKIKKIYLYPILTILALSLFALGPLGFFKGSDTIDSIAVMPFELISENQELEYVCEGIARNIINSLTPLSRLETVISWNSVSTYKDNEEPIIAQVVGQELGVDALLISQLTHKGNDLGVSTELVTVSESSLLWGHQYDPLTLSEIQGIHGDISKNIAENLGLKLKKKDQIRLTRQFTSNSEAYKFYLQGLFFWEKRIEEGTKKGVEYFQRAIDKDPDFALAYVGLANCYALFALQGQLPPDEAVQQTEKYALKALELNPTLGEAHTPLAQVKYFYELDYAAAEKEFKRAIKLNPGYATAHQWYSDLLMTLGRKDEAVREARRAYELDPISLAPSYSLGQLLLFNKQYDKALEQSQKLYEIAPDSYLSPFLLGSIYLYQQNYEDAIVELKKCYELSGGKGQYAATLAKAYVGNGNKEAALNVFDELITYSMQNNIPALGWAQIYSSLGDMDKSLDWLEKAYENRNYWILFIHLDPLFDILRDEPRFKTLLKKLNLE